jgi:hypothetical protein
MLFDLVNRQPILPAQNIFPPEPCHHARGKILSYLDLTHPALLQYSGRTYLASILSVNGIDFQQAYHGDFFTNKFFGSVINVDSWLVSPHASPPFPTNSHAIPSLHIFDFLASLWSISHGQNLFPATGLTPLQARHVYNLVYFCFAAKDIKENFLTCPFQSSILGSRLHNWLQLLDAPAILFLWERCPCQASYQWMLSCWTLLHIFQRWITAIKWQPMQGFTTVQDSCSMQYHLIADSRTATSM